MSDELMQAIIMYTAEYIFVQYFTERLPHTSLARYLKSYTHIHAYLDIII